MSRRWPDSLIPKVILHYSSGISIIGMKPIPKILHQIWWQGLDDLINKSKIVYGSDMYNKTDWRAD